MIYQKVQYIQVTANAVGQRIDNFLVPKLAKVPKSRIYRILRKGEVRVNKGRVKPEYKLCLNDVVRIPPINLEPKKPLDDQSPKLAGKQSFDLAKLINFEDDNLLVINKPAGLAVHGGSGLNLGLIEYLRSKLNNQDLSLVHRLDKATSGLVMVAKNRQSLLKLQKAIISKDLKKTYLAIVKNDYKTVSQINLPLKKIVYPDGNKKVIVAQDGKQSLTIIKKLQVINKQDLGDFSFVEASPVTGRTHQIRVHLASMHAPIVGDSKYGDFNTNRQLSKFGFNRLFLHAKSLKLPDLKNPGKYFTVTSETPDEFLSFFDNN